MKYKGTKRLLGTLATIAIFAISNQSFAGNIDIIPQAGQATSVGIGQSITMDLVGSAFATPGAATGDVVLNFDPTLFQINASTLSTDAVWTGLSNITLDNTNGSVAFEVGVPFGDQTGWQTDFIVGTIEFVATAIGTSSLIMSDYKVGWFGGPNLGSINVTYGDTATISAVPIPPAIWLLGSGIVGLIGMARRNRNLN